MLKQMLVILYPLFLGIPVVLTSILDYDVPPAFLIIPFAFICLVKSARSLDAIFFMVSIITGLLSCLIGEIFQASDTIWKPILSMILILISPSLIFLGQSINRKDYLFKEIFEYLAIFSSIFSIVLVARLLLSGGMFRYEIDPSVTDIKIGSNLDAYFMGFPVFGVWGVLSLAHLFCVQTFVCSGTLIGEKVRIHIRILAGIGLLCFIYLIIESDSRSAQLGTAWLIGAYLFFKFKSWAKRFFIVILLTIFFVLVLFNSQVSSENSRLLQSITSGISGSNVSDLSTGRTDLIDAAFKDIEKNPIIGVGFGTFNRFLNGFSSEHTLHNSSTHIYLLTIIWKGGLIFALPLFAMFFFVAQKVWKRRNEIWASAEEYFAFNAVLVSFFVLSMTWDILIVPTAGALVFFLFGMLSVSKDKLNNNSRVR